MLQQHLPRPDHTDGVRDALPGDIGRAAVHRLEQTGELPLRVDVPRRRDADRARAGGSQIRQDIPEQVAPHDDVEDLRALDEMRRQDVDVVLVDGDVGVALRHLPDAAVPVRHGDADAVALGGARQLPAGPRPRQLERVPEDAVDARARHDGLLDDGLALRPLEHRAPDAAVLALGVLAHDPEVDVARPPPRERRPHPRHQPARPQVDVLVELAPELQQAAPERHVVGHLVRQPHRPEVDGVELEERLLPVRRQHRPVLPVVGAARERERLEGEGQAEYLGRCFERPDPVRHHFGPDAVAGDHGDAEGLLRCSCHLDDNYQMA